MLQRFQCNRPVGKSVSLVARRTQFNVFPQCCLIFDSPPEDQVRHDPLQWPVSNCPSFFELCSSLLAFARDRSFLRRVKRMILKRIVVFRVMFYGTLILTVGSFLQANKASESQ